ncbi:MAG: DUF58 domain-containing protein [Lentisphaeria bacterium]|jgi:uncharacterized protein (DUF58 family)
MAGSHYLSTEVLARVSNMQLLAKAIVEGFLLGLHRSPFHGSSVEFSEYRQYTAGEEIKHIDWKVYAKTDRYYIKRFEAETNLACHILLDASASMSYKSRADGLSKLQYGASLAACLAYFMIGQRDATGLTIFDNQIRAALPPRLGPTHLQRVLTELDGLKPGGDTDLAGPMNAMAEGLKRRGLVIIISDLLANVEGLRTALSRFRFQGHDLIVFHILDDAELTFPFDALTEFTDLETGQATVVSPAGMKATYLRELKKFLGDVQKACADVKADYGLFNTQSPLELALSEYLHRRSRLH